MKIFYTLSTKDEIERDGGEKEREREGKKVREREGEGERGWEVYKST